MMWKFQISIFYSEYNIDDISNVKTEKMYHFKGKNKLILNLMASTHLKIWDKAMFTTVWHPLFFL